MGKDKCSHTSYNRRCHTCSLCISISIATGNSRINFYAGSKYIHFRFSVVRKFRGISSFNGITTCTNSYPVRRTVTICFKYRLWVILHFINVGGIISCCMNKQYIMLFCIFNGFVNPFFFGAEAFTKTHVDDLGTIINCIPDS